MPVANQTSPMAVALVDPTSGALVSGSVVATPTTVAQVANYTAISTIGTATVKATPGIYYGFTVLSTGTAAMNIQVLDGANVVFPALAAGAIGGFQAPVSGGLGIKCVTSILVVTTGTAGSINAVWD